MQRFSVFLTPIWILLGFFSSRESEQRRKVTSVDEVCPVSHLHSVREPLRLRGSVLLQETDANQKEEVKVQ